MQKIILMAIVGILPFIAIGCGATKSAEYDKFQERQINIASGSICTNGGSATLRGVDLNKNGYLDDYEILNSKSTYACQGDQGERGPIGPSGEDGRSCHLNNQTPFTVSDAAIITESGCSNGGIVNTFACTDASTYNTYSCNGEDGKTTLSIQTEESNGTNCTTGGIKYETGLDINDNGILDAAEITNTYYVCNGDAVLPPESLGVGNNTLWKIKNLQFSGIGGAIHDINNVGSFLQGLYPQGVTFRYRDGNNRFDICRSQVNWSVSTGLFTGGDTNCRDGGGHYFYSSSGFAYLFSGSGIKISQYGVVTAVGGAYHVPASRQLCWRAPGTGTSCVSYNIEWEYLPL